MKNCIFLILLSGCMPTLGLDGNICGEPSFSDLDRYAVEVAIDSWNKASNGQIRLTYSEKTGDDSQCDAFVSHGVLDDNYGGMCYTDQWKDPYIVIDLKTVHAPGVIAHEIGHALGAEHSSFALDVMASIVHKTQRYNPRPTTRDVRAVLDAN